MKSLEVVICVFAILTVWTSAAYGEKEKNGLNSFSGVQFFWSGQNFARDSKDSPTQHGRWDRNDFKCPYPFGTFPDPADCSQYYECKKGTSSHMRCKRNMHFDIFRKKCLPKFIAVCGKSEKTTTVETKKTTPDDGSFSCPKLMGLFPHPEDCASFYSCFLYKPTLKVCPENELFDAIKISCKPAETVHCGNRRRPTTPFVTTVTSIVETTAFATTTDGNLRTTEREIPTETTSDCKTTTDLQTSTEEPVTEQGTTLPDVLTESTHVTEVEVSTAEGSTPSATETPLNTKPKDLTTEIKITKPTGPPDTNCDEDDVDCIITETGEVSVWFTCPEDMGSHPHPSSDKLFIFCLNWKPSVKRCGQDLVFSKESLTCILPKKI